MSVLTGGFVHLLLLNDHNHDVYYNLLIIIMGVGVPALHENPVITPWLPRHHRGTPLLEKLHWLPISEHIKYKVACMCFSAINGSGPAYLSELLHVYTPSRTLRSSSNTRLLEIQQYKRKTWLPHFLLLWTPHLEFTPTRP